MELSTKAIRFVIEALDHYQQYHDERLRSEGISEDQLSDLLRVYPEGSPTKPVVVRRRRDNGTPDLGCSGPNDGASGEAR